MKKLLLSMAVLLGAFTMSAEPVTVDFSTATNLPTTEAEEPSTATINGVDFTFVNCKQGKYQGATYLQISGKNHEGKAYMEFTAGFAVEKITMHTGTNASTNVTVQLYANDVAVGGALKLGEKDADFTIAVPAANQAAGTKYKLATSNKYNAQITTLTFNGDGSAVEPPVVETKKAANIGEFLKAADADNLTEITSTVTAVYQNGRYLYVTDATGNLLVYGDLDTKYTNGNIIPAGITGKYQNFSEGLLQMSSLEKATFKAGTAGTAVQPEEITVEEIGTDMVNKYIVVKNVSIAKAEAANTYDLTDETGTMALYNTFYNSQYYDVVEVIEGSELNVEGFVSVHSGVAQITPVRVYSATGMEQVAAPVFTPAAGTVEEGTEVTIACATEGAKIYYTLDGTTPSATSTLYTAAIVINEETTINAIAIKEGMLDSRVVEAKYIISEPVVITGDAQFNFGQPNTLNPAQNIPTSDTPAGDAIDGIKFTNNGVTVEFSAGSSASRMYYGYNTGVEARLYKTGTITITAPENNPIKMVEFTGAGIGNLSVDGTPVENMTWTSEAGVDKFVATTVEQQETKNGRVDFKTISVTLEKSGVMNIELDLNAPVEYYNLQGVRVENPTSGLYIRRQGNNVSKVVL